MHLESYLCRPVDIVDPAELWVLLLEVEAVRPDEAPQEPQEAVDVDHAQQEVVHGHKLESKGRFESMNCTIGSIDLSLLLLFGM